MTQFILTIQLPFLLASQVSTSGTPASLSAREALKQASEARYVLPSDLSALYSHFVVSDNEGELRGSIAWTRSDGLKVTVAGTGERVQDYERRVESLIQHRLPNDFDQGDGRHNLTWTGEDNLIGKQIALNDAMKSRYRINANAIVEVDRTVGDTRLIVSVVEVEKLATGKHLPKAMVVSYFDATSGALKRTEAVLDTYTHHDGVLVPAARRVYISEGGKIRMINISLSEFRFERK